MNGHDAARDELAIALADLTGLHGIWSDVCDVASATELADSLIELGYRRSVTPDEIEAAQDAIDHDDNGKDWLAEAKLAARAFGLEVTE